MFRIITFGVVWSIGMVGGMLIGLSNDNWAERLAIRYGDDPGAGGRALRFGVVCLGVFILPILHIVIWEIVAWEGG